MEFFSFFKEFGPYALLCACLMWYIWQKDKMHKEEIEKLGKKIDRLTSTIERFLTFIKEKG